ncbi:MAG: glycosyltransferase family 2 protein [Acidobacteriota bacterium]
MTASVYGLVIAYNPSPEILQNVTVLSLQVDHVVVVDNTPGSEPQTVIDELQQRDGCTVIRNGKNLGIAEALNIGIRFAISQGGEWIFTFDQDSQITPGYVQKMLTAHAEASKSSPVGMVFPVYQDARLGHIYAQPKSANGDVLVGMTSGALLHRDVFNSIGPMETEFVIDQVDHEYCLRMRSLGLRLIGCPQAVLIHSLGRITFHNFLGRRYKASNHSAKRRYYITRNRLILMKRYFHKDPEWVRYDSGMIHETLSSWFFERQKFMKLIYIARAIFDAAFERLGQRVRL